MGRYTLGKSVGTTDKGSSRKHTPAPNTLGQATVSPVQEIKQPTVVPQKWQGSTFVNAPSPTLVPNLQLPSLKNVLAEPQRDMGRLAKALEGFNSQLVPFATAAINLGAKQREYYGNEADRIIGQNPGADGTNTSLNQLKALQVSLNEEASQKPNDKGEYREGTTIESIASAKKQLDYIKNNSRLQDAIKSKYKERDRLSRAASLSSAQKTATIKGSEEIIENGISKTVEIDIPVNTLSPNDPRYQKWVDNYLNKDAPQLNSFEYHNIKGKLVQYRSNAMTAQSALYSTHLDNKMLDNIIETTTHVGTRLGNGTISRKEATFELQELLEKMNIYGTSTDNKKKFSEELAINVIAAFTKAAEEGTSNPEIIKDTIKFLATGPKDSRVNSEGIFNEKQSWMNDFPVGWLDQRYQDAMTRIKGHDSNAQKVLNDRIQNTADEFYTEDIKPILFKDGELAPENMHQAIGKLKEWKKDTLKGASIEETRAINKAYNSLEKDIYGIFDGDYDNDESMLRSLFYEAFTDPTKLGRFDYYLNEFNTRWEGYSKAQTVAADLQYKAQVLRGKNKENITRQFDSTLKVIENWYTKKWGVLPNSEGGTENFEEIANWQVMKTRLINNIFERLGPGASEEDVKKELEKLTKEWADADTSQDQLDKRLPFLKDLLNDRRVDYSWKAEDGPKYKGNTDDALGLFTVDFDQSDVNKLDKQIDIKNVWESEQPFFDANTIGSIADKVFTADPTKEINFDPRLKTLINNLPGRYNGKTGQFLLREFEKHGIQLDEAEKTLLTGLDNVEKASLLPSGSYNV